MPQNAKSISSKPLLRQQFAIQSKKQSKDRGIILPQNKIATKNIFCALKFSIIYKQHQELSFNSLILLSVFTSIFRMGYLCLSCNLEALSESLASFTGKKLSVRTLRRALTEVERLGLIRRGQCRLGDYSNGVLLFFTPKLTDMSEKNLHRPNLTDFRSYNNSNNLPTYIDQRVDLSSRSIPSGTINKHQDADRRSLDALVAGLIGGNSGTSVSTKRSKQIAAAPIRPAVELCLSAVELAELKKAAAKLQEIAGGYEIVEKPDTGTLSDADLEILDSYNEVLNERRRALGIL